MITESVRRAKIDVDASPNHQGGKIMNNCICNLFDDNWIWLIIIAILLISCCCN
jgi:hypothetical protein